MDCPRVDRLPCGQDQTHSQSKQFKRFGWDFCEMVQSGFECSCCRFILLFLFAHHNKKKGWNGLGAIWLGLIMIRTADLS